MMKSMKTILSITLYLNLLVGLGSCAQNSTNIFPLEQIYLSPRSLAASLTELNRLHPQQTSLHVIGFSGVNSIPIQALAIGNASATRKALVIGQHHGDEVLGIEIAQQIAQDLLSSSEQSTRILSEFQVWIVPTLNPESWQIVRSGDYQWKRKNNHDTNQNGSLDVRDDGVDLNRNYPVFWTEDKLLPVSDPNYKGTSAASEAEVQATISLAEQERFELAMFYHSSATGLYSDKLYLPAI